MSDNIKVAIKVRPLIKREIDEKLESQWTIHDNTIVPLDPDLKKRGEGGFSFDHILNTDQTNEDLFEIVAKPIIDQAVNGINGTIFAYGQTSSGKTYTMMGTRDSAGVIPLAVDYIFDKIEQSYHREYLLRVSYLEIYNERTYDLLDKNKVDLKITEDPKTGQASVKCKEEVINCAEKVLTIMKKGDRNRRTGETNMNERSSRSHTIFRLIIESRESNGDSNGVVNVSQLNLVDLAGSERARQTGATGERFHEGVQINLSLSKLGLVIMQLSEDNQQYINFRDSKLTRMLQSSLGGNAMTAIICAVTPAALEETQCTLAFASRAKRIKNKPQVNEVLSDQALLRRYAKQMLKLEEELEEAKSADVVEMASKLEEKERALQLLAERHERLKKAIVGGCGGSQENQPAQKRDMRRRTWAGSGTFQSKIPLLPTIIEVDGSISPEKQKEKTRVQQRQSIIQTLDDIVNQNFNTKITDFELELMESERANCEYRLSSGSNANDEEFCFRTITTRRQGHTVKFQDDPVTFESSDDSSETLSGRKTPESCELESQVSPDTPKPVLRSRLAFLSEQFSDLSTNYRNLDEYTKLERQIICEDTVEALKTEHQQLLAASEEKCQQLEEKCQRLEEKCSNFEIQSVASEKRLTELEQQLAESAELEKQLVELASSMQILQREKKNLMDEVKRLTILKPENPNESKIPIGPEDSSSIFANITQFEDTHMSDIDGDSVSIDYTQNFQDFEFSSNSAGNFSVKKLDESNNKGFGLSNSGYRNFIDQISDKSTEELVTIIQRLNDDKRFMNDEISKLQALQQRKARETEDIKNAVREFKSGMEKLQETVQQLTNENTELTSKLVTEKEHAKDLQSIIENMKSTNIIATAKELETSLKNNSEMISSGDEELQNSLEQAKKMIAFLTAENEELSSSLMSNLEEMERLKNEPVPTDHECVYRELSISLSDRNRILEAENIELSNNLMEKIEKYDDAKAKIDNYEKSKLISPNATLTESSRLIEIFSDTQTNGNDNRTDSTGNESQQKTVDDLWRLSFDNSQQMQPLLKLTTDESISPENSIIPNGSTCENKIQRNIENADTSNIESIISDKKPTNDPAIANNIEFDDTKISSCPQCTHLAQLIATRKLHKLEIKELNKKLNELQKTFDREDANSKLLRTKANEKMDLSICNELNISDIDGTLNLNVSFVDEKAQALYQELESVRDNHEKLSNRVDEKCNEITILQGSTRIKRNDVKYEKIQTEIEKLRKDYQISRKNITVIKDALKKIIHGKNIEQTKESTNVAIKDNDDNIMVSFKNDVASMNEEIMHCNEARQKLENEKSILQSEVEHLRSGTAADNNIIVNLNEEVVHLNEKIIQCNAVKEELESAKYILQAEVEYLRTEKTNNFAIKKDDADSLSDLSSPSSNNIDTSNDKTTILNLNNDVSRLNDEIIRINEIKNELTMRINEEEANTLISQERIVTLENEIIRLREEIHVYDTTNQQFETVKDRDLRVNELLESLKNLETANSRLSIDLENVTSERNELMKKIDSIVAESQDPDLRGNGSLELLKNLEAINLQLTTDLGNVTSEKKELMKKIDILVAENQDRDLRGKDSIESLKYLETVNSKLSIDLENLTSQRNELIEKIDLFVAENQERDLRETNLIESLNNLEARNVSLTTHLENVTSERNELSKKIDTLVAESQDRDLRGNDSLETLKNLETVNSKLSMDLKNLTSQRNELIEKIDLFVAENQERDLRESNLLETLKNLEAMNSSLTTDLENVMSERNELTKRIDTLVAESQDRDLRASDSLESFKSLETVNSKLSIDLENLTLQRNELIEKIDTLVAENQDRDLRENNLLESLKNVETANSRLKINLENVTSERNELAEKLDTLVTKSKDRDLRENDSLESLKNLEAMNSRLTIDLENLTSEKNELIKRIDILVAKSTKESSKMNEDDSSSSCTSELKLARECIIKEIKYLETTSEQRTSEADKFVGKSISELFGIFVQAIMSKEGQIIGALKDQHKNEKQKLQEQIRQGRDSEKRANAWTKELEEEIERAQGHLALHDEAIAKYNREIAKLENLLKESNHENQVLNDKMKASELDFNTLQSELTKQRNGDSICDSATHEKDRLVQQAIETRELELSAKLRSVEKHNREKIDEFLTKLEHYKTKNLELTNTLEGLEANERHSKNIADMKTNELVKVNSILERLREDFDLLTKNHNQLTQQHSQTVSQMDEITCILKTKCDKLSEYKTKLETITPEYEYLKDQSIERQRRLEKYKSEIESITDASEKEIASLKRRLETEEITSTDYRKRLEDLTNRNIVFENELKQLRQNCEDLELTNAKLTKSMRNSTSKIRAEEEMEDLRDVNRTLQRNLDGASNRIVELQGKKSSIQTELIDLRVKYDALINELNTCKITISRHTESVNEATKLREKYETLIQEKNRIELANEALKCTVIQLEGKLKTSMEEIDGLKTTNKDLDEEMDDMLGKIRELENDNAVLDDKLYKIETENENLGSRDQLKTEIEKLEKTIETSKQTMESLRNENTELKAKYSGYSERGGDFNVNSCDSSRSASPAIAIEATRIDNRRRRSRTELYNLKRPLDMIETIHQQNQVTSLPYGECRCTALEEKVCKLERELVTKNGEIAAMELRIQSENFPHMNRCRDLEELLASSKRRCKTLESEIDRIRNIKVQELSRDCDRCRHWSSNKRDQSTQCLPQSAPICLNGMSSGIVEDYLKIKKLEKNQEFLKSVCRARHQQIVELEAKLKKHELKKDAN